MREAPVGTTLDRGWALGRGALDVVRHLFSKGAPRRFARDEYKAVWNSISGSETDAMLAVGGSSDEASYAKAAENTLALLRETVGVRPDDVILEIGAGFGRVGSVLAPLCREWIGTDVSENMVSHMRRRLSRFPNVRAIATNGYDLQPIAAGSVDLVYCTVVFMHLDEWDRYGYVAESLRILKPGGRLLVDNINIMSDGGWEIFEAHRAFPPGGRRPNISKTSTPQEILTYFRRARFEAIRQIDIDPWVVTTGVKPQAAA